MSKSTFYLGVEKMSLRHPKDTQNHFHVLNRKMTHVSQKREFRPFQNHAQVHQIRRPPRKMMSETTSHFAHTYIPQSFMNMQKYRTRQADEKVSHVLRLSRKTKFQIAKCPNAPATKNGHSLKKRVPRAGKSRPSEESTALCASLCSQNAHGHPTRELLREQAQTKARAHS